MADVFDPIADFALTEAGQASRDLLNRERKDTSISPLLQQREQRARDIEAFGLAEQQRGHDSVLNQIPGSMEIDGDAYAALRKMAADVNVSTQVLLGLKKPDKQLRSKWIVESMRGFLKENPRALKFLLDPENIILTYDDTPALMTVHRALQNLERSEEDRGFVENLTGTGEVFVKMLEQSGLAIGFSIAAKDDDSINWANAYDAMMPEEKTAFDAMPRSAQSASDSPRRTGPPMASTRKASNSQCAMA